jgi:hypothetical protein
MSGKQIAEFLHVFADAILDGTLEDDVMTNLTLTARSKPAAIPPWEIARIRTKEYGHLSAKAFLADHTLIMLGTPAQRGRNRDMALIAGMLPNGELNILLEGPEIHCIRSLENGKYFSCYAPVSNMLWHYLWKWNNGTAELVWKVNGGCPVLLEPEGELYTNTLPLFYRHQTEEGEDEWRFVNTISNDVLHYERWQAVVYKKDHKLIGHGYRAPIEPLHDCIETFHIGHLGAHPLILHKNYIHGYLSCGNMQYQITPNYKLSGSVLRHEDDTLTLFSVISSFTSWRIITVAPEGISDCPNNDSQGAPLQKTKQERHLEHGFELLIPGDATLSRKRGKILIQLNGENGVRATIKVDLLMWDRQKGFFYAARHAGQGTISLMALRPYGDGRPGPAASLQALQMLSLRNPLYFFSPTP